MLRGKFFDKRGQDFFKSSSRLFVFPMMAPPC